MRRFIPLSLAAASTGLASETVFSVFDDILAFPQYEVILSEAFISDAEANLILGSSSPKPSSSLISDIQSVESQTSAHDSTVKPKNAFDPAHETYEMMYLHGEQHLCTIPIVDKPPRNETSEAEARAAEQKELTRATDRGWELLQDMDGNCLYFASGWWSYQFCYNAEITQFHPLPPQPGKYPQRDPKTKQYTLGRAQEQQAPGDEWATEVETRKEKPAEPPKTELQVKGDTRYLMQKMDGGTVCDLTGKPRRIEIQFHCNPHHTDRIGYIKEVTICSYLMVVYTPRLCNDVAFIPPKDTKAHPIMCRAVIPAQDFAYHQALKSLESDMQERVVAQEESDVRPRVGGLVVGAGKWMNQEGARMPIPTNFGKGPETGRNTEVIARAESKAEGGNVESISDADLMKLDLDPAVVEQLKEEVQKMAKEKGWKIEVVHAPGEVRELLAIVDETDDDESSDEGSQEGSQEIYKDEL